MKMKKTLAFLMSAMMTVSMTACGGSSSASSQAPASSAAPAESSAPSAAEPAGSEIEITWWAFPTFGQENADDPVGTYEQKIIDAFQDANPGIKVKLDTIDFTNGPEKIVSAIEGGNAPDVLFDAPGRIIEYGNNGKLVPLDDLFTADFIADVNNDALVEACKGKGTPYMYPISSSPFYMAINKQMWEDAGAMEFVNLEGDRTWSTADWEKAIEKLAAAGMNPGTVFCNGQGGDQGTRAFITNLYGATIANPEMTEYTANSDAGVQALTKMKEWIDKGWLGDGVSNTAANDIELFATGFSSFAFCWGTSTALAQAPNMEAAGVTPISLPFPSDDGVPELEYLVNGFCVFDNGDAARADAAKKLIQFICDDPEWGPKNVVRTGAFPVRQSFAEKDLYAGNEEYAVLENFTKYYAPYYNTMDGFANMRTEWWNMLQNVISNGTDPKEALDAYAAASNAGMTAA